VQTATISTTFASRGDNTFGFEDLANGGDNDYNDLTIKMDFTV
jgi:hypothetical protein